MSDNIRWQAVVNRDAAFDNVFVYAVRTTGIYCRPICKARLARRSNVEFFAKAADAEQAGYRRCKRCRPQLDCFQPEADKIRAVCESLQRLPSDAPLPGLESLAREAGLTKHHFHRLFKRETGLTPREYAIAVRSGSSSAAGTSPASAPTTPSKVHQQLEQFETTTSASGTAVAALYAAVETTYGLLLVVFQHCQMCMIELCADQTEVAQVLEAHFPRSQRLSEPADSNAYDATMSFQRHIDAVVEALERPSGKMLDLPSTVSGRPAGHA